MPIAILSTEMLPKLAADPGSAVAGWMYYNTTSNTVRCYNGTSWQSVDTRTYATRAWARLAFR